MTWFEFPTHRSTVGKQDHFTLSGLSSPRYRAPGLVHSAHLFFMFSYDSNSFRPDLRTFEGRLKTQRETTLVGKILPLTVSGEVWFSVSMSCTSLLQNDFDPEILHPPGSPAGTLRPERGWTPGRIVRYDSAPGLDRSFSSGPLRKCVEQA